MRLKLFLNGLFVFLLFLTATSAFSGGFKIIVIEYLGGDVELKFVFDNFKQASSLSTEEALAIMPLAKSMPIFGEISKGTRSILTMRTATIERTANDKWRIMGSKNNSDLKITLEMDSEKEWTGDMEFGGEESEYNHQGCSVWFAN
jgi:hypothetical protein